MIQEFSSFMLSSGSRALLNVCGRKHNSLQNYKNVPWFYKTQFFLAKKLFELKGNKTQGLFSVCVLLGDVSAGTAVTIYHFMLYLN